MQGKVVIIGPADTSAALFAARMEQLKVTLAGAEMVTLDEALERGLVFRITARPPLPIVPVGKHPNLIAFEPGGMSKRAARRKAERDAKKKKKP